MVIDRSDKESLNYHYIKFSGYKINDPFTFIMTLLSDIRINLPRGS